MEEDLAADDVEEGAPGLPTATGVPRRNGASLFNGGSGGGLMSGSDGFGGGGGSGGGDEEEEFRPFIRRLPEVSCILC